MITRRDLFGLATVAAGASLLRCSSPPRSDIPVLAETDVLVVGGGPAGLAAALAAARAGARTMIIERYGFFGGVISQATMGSITWYRYAQTVDAGGICAELERRAHDMGGSINTYASLDPSYYPIIEFMGLMVNGKPTYEILDTELFKVLADVLLLEAGVKPLLHCWAVDALRDGPMIKGVVTESKSGRQAIYAERVIDATGDADVAFQAGAPFRKSPKGELMEVTVNFSCSNVDVKAFGMYVLSKGGTMRDWATTSGKEDHLFSTHLFEPFEKAKAAGEIPADVTIRAYPGAITDSEILSLNAVHLDSVDPTDVADLTYAEMEGRKRVMLAMSALKKYTPGFGKAKLRNISCSLGTRESRKIIGEYNITEADVTNEARFADSIGICPEFLDGYGILYLPTTGRYFQVPYRITVPQDVENLLVAGRCVAGDRMSHAATRAMACCMVTGQGAGVAAAISFRDGTTCRQVNLGSVQQELSRQGTRIA